jgi:polyhydroxyalkanoate synthesis regulator phasin
LLTDLDKTNTMAVASHSLVMSLMDTLVAKSILTSDEAKGVIDSAISAIDDMEGLVNIDSATSILRAYLKTFDKRSSETL